MTHLRNLTVLLFCALLAACTFERETLKIGGKDFSESKILSEMMAALAENAGIPVTRRIGLGPTLLNLESLKRGDIDLYAEYNGTGLVMLGQPALADGDEAMEKVRSLYEPLGLAWGERFGFANNYGLALQSARAEEMGISTISDLVGRAGDMKIGIDENFEGRPLDGFQPLTARYGMTFGDVVTVPAEDRPSLYDRLLSGEVDVIEIFTTDGQIADYDLTVLEDDLGFFPVYEAAPLIRADALVKFPALRETLRQLAGKLDEATMRRLNSQVEQDALAPRMVARAALAEMGLIDDADALEISEPLLVAASPLATGTTEEGLALRAVREAFPNRRVLFDISDDPLAAVGAGEARVGLVTVTEAARIDAEGGVGQRPVEAVGVVGQSYLHLIAGGGDVSSLADIGTLLTGPEGSASHRAGTILAAGMENIEIVPKAADAFEAALAAGEGDAALLLAPLGSETVTATLEHGRLIPITGWVEGNNLVRYPQLRRARIPARTYDRQFRPIESLSSQLVLVGPVVEEEVDAVGPQGPGASAPTPVSELSGDTVKALSKALGNQPGFDPAIPVAAALAPQLPEPPAALNPSLAVSILNVLVIILFAWLIYLYARPERSRRS